MTARAPKAPFRSAVGDAEALPRLADALARIEALLPPGGAPDFGDTLAFRWRKRRYLGMERGVLEAVTHPALVAFDDLQHVDAQRDTIRRNTEQFVRRLPANNVLLTGARGTGKSSLILSLIHI